MLIKISALYTVFSSECSEFKKTSITRFAIGTKERWTWTLLSQVANILLILILEINTSSKFFKSSDFGGDAYGVMEAICNCRLYEQKACLIRRNQLGLKNIIEDGKNIKKRTRN